jgi:NADH:ubiquinone oxidoreductase subunit 5 (subunit L)/multisubunit Na+/H+ antiporter MnhA subunit
MSKDAVLLAAHHHTPWIYWVGVVTAGMTAFYVFRAMFLTFFGEYRGHHHPHESPMVMLFPLMVLAVLSLAGGYLFPIPKILEHIFPLAAGSPRNHAGRNLGCRRSDRYLSGVADVHRQTVDCRGHGRRSAAQAALQQILRG